MWMTIPLMRMTSTGSACSGIARLPDPSAVSDVAKTVVGTELENPCLRDPFAGGANSTTFDGCEAEARPQGLKVVLGPVGVRRCNYSSGGAAAGRGAVDHRT